MGLLHDWINDQRETINFAHIDHFLIHTLQARANDFVNEHPGPYKLLVKQNDAINGVEYVVEVEERYETWVLLALL